ncbi:hypothetical protein [Rickettsiella endosymbiont of Dermanyssus gallinae]|uniref:hypothetical protein n=1 Tax=Rickettsiella endosymbiont of Dermanyssus gallinae TaxID=2856608 RepID=UPI001C534033|nr:hypothetical protein [Rickettsiella endosymbiont of Dermanyssus gallinae]
MKLSFLLLLSFVVSVTGCSSVNNYIKTHKSQYLYSQDLGPLKKPNSLKIKQTQYIIPEINAAKPTQLPDLYPPID